MSRPTQSTKLRSELTSEEHKSAVGRLIRTAVWFSLATAFSRVIGLVREVLAASYFGVSGPMSAFTVAFQVPNFVRTLVADAALNSAFVPVFTNLLVTGRRREAMEAASAFAFVLAISLGVLTAAFVLFAAAIIPLATPGFHGRELQSLTIDLARIMFPIVPLMALSALTMAMFQSFEQFALPALAPIAWNVVVITVLVFFAPNDSTQHGLQVYAIGVLVATLVQLALPLPWFRKRGFTVTRGGGFRNPNVRRMLSLMLPVTLSLGLINLGLIVDSLFGTLVAADVPAAIDKAYRLVLVPQGLVPLALSTTLFPIMARLASAEDFERLREIVDVGLYWSLFFLIPAMVLILVLAEPITRLAYERGQFTSADTTLVGTALLLWAMTLPSQGVAVLLSRVFFSLQRPWPVALLAVGNLLLNATLSGLLYRPFGMVGILSGTVAATVIVTQVQGGILARLLPSGGAELARLLVRLCLAAGVMAGVTEFAWRMVDGPAESGRPVEALALAVVALAGVTGFLAAARVLRLPTSPRSMGKGSGPGLRPRHH